MVHPTGRRALTASLAVALLLAIDVVTTAAPRPATTSTLHTLRTGAVTVGGAGEACRVGPVAIW